MYFFLLSLLSISNAMRTKATPPIETAASHNARQKFFIAKPPVISYVFDFLRSKPVFTRKHAQLFSKVMLENPHAFLMNASSVIKVELTKTEQKLEKLKAFYMRFCKYFLRKVLTLFRRDFSR